MEEYKIYKKILLSLLILSLLTLLFITGTSAENYSPNIDDQTLIVGFNLEFSPFGYKNEYGEYAGFDIDLAKEVCKRNNWTFRPQPIIN